MSQHNTIMLAALQQSSVATAVYTSAALHIGFISEGMLALWGQKLTNEDAQFPDLLPDGDQGYLANLISDVWNSGKSFHLVSYPILIKSKHNTQLVFTDWDIQPLINGDGVTEALIHTIRPVENPLHTIKQRSLFGDAAFADEKLRKWSRALSHDLRNPLSVAKLGMQYMRSRQQMTPEENQKWINVVIDALQSAEKLITDVVEVSKDDSKENTVHQDTEVAYILQDIFSRCTTYFNLDRWTVDNETLHAVQADNVQLYRVLTLAIQSAGQLTADRKQIAPMIISSRDQNAVCYTIGLTGLSANKPFIGLTVLEQLMLQLRGTASIDYDNKQLRLNFPVL